MLNYKKYIILIYFNIIPFFSYLFLSEINILHQYSQLMSKYTGKIQYLNHLGTKVDRTLE